MLYFLICKQENYFCTKNTVQITFIRLHETLQQSFYVSLYKCGNVPATFSIALQDEAATMSNGVYY